MTLKDIAFIGGSGTVAAINAAYGTVVWRRSLRKSLFQSGSSFVSFCLSGDILVVHTNGKLLGLSALTGATIWEDRMDEFQSGICSLISGDSDARAIALAQHQIQSDAQQHATMSAAAVSGG
jgi:outer membrane protein assembly factor BamB